MAFVVRVDPGEEDRVSGIVERVKTGEKHRFHGAEAIGPLIAEMVRHETRELDATSERKRRRTRTC